MKKYVLIIDDDLVTAQQIKSHLEDDATVVCHAPSAHEGLESFLKNPYCLVIMSIDFAETDGLTLLQLMRQAKPVPIFIISSKTSVEATVQSLHYGADDYLHKPFDIEECLARAKAQIRRYTELGGDKERSYILVCGPDLLIDPNARKASLRGKELELSQKQFDMLYFLASNAGRVVSKGRLFEYLWSEPDVDVENSISKHIHNLRRIMNDDPDSPEYIHTVRGIGYRFECGKPERRKAEYREKDSGKEEE